MGLSFESNGGWKGVSYAAGGAREARGRTTDADCCEIGCAATTLTMTVGATTAGAVVGSCVGPAAQTAQMLPFPAAGWECTTGSSATRKAIATMSNGSRRSILNIRTFPVRRGKQALFRAGIRYEKGSFATAR